MKTSIEVGSDYVTRRGNPVTVVRTGLKSNTPVLAIEHNPAGDFVLEQREDGRYYNNGRDHESDILRKLPEPQQAERWAPGVGEHVTRGGGEAVVASTEGSDSAFPLIGIVRSAGADKWDQESWTRDGRVYGSREDASDLVAPKPEAVSEPLLEGWVNVYGRGRAVHFFRTEAEAKSHRCDNFTNDFLFLRCVRVREVAEEGGGE